MSLNIVLVEPEIPTNTGNIGRLSLATGSTLHLVKPLGFDLDNKRLKRAGLDYWKHIDLYIYEDIDEFFTIHKSKKMVFFSSHGKKTYWSIEYKDDMFLVFGKESEGLHERIINANKGDIYKIPLYSEHIRSLNLSNAVSIAVYEGLKQLS